MKKLIISASLLVLLCVTCNAKIALVEISPSTHNIDSILASAVPPGSVITGISIATTETGLYTYLAIAYQESNVSYSITLDENAKLAISNWPDKFNVVVDWDNAFTSYVIYTI